MSRYTMTKRPLLEGEHLLACTECGALISDSHVTAHDKWHELLDLRRELGAEHQRLNHEVHGGGAP